MIKSNSKVKSEKFFGRPAPDWFVSMVTDHFIKNDDTEYSVSDLAAHYKKTKSTIRNVLLRQYEKIYEQKFQPQYTLTKYGTTEVLFKGIFLKKLSSDYINENVYIK
ncbi:hypothetical protein [Silvanigrella sp.]|jgi:hypothetical protein|uniref:hypothetical protein n=1 Tax=Silvanigrella sp. TaxID=2024976 RepID=UPI0037C8A1FC